MLAEFDQDHKIRVIRFQYPAEVEVCADIAKEVEKVPDVPVEAYSTAGLIISLAANEDYKRDGVSLPEVCGQDADGLIKFLDIGARVTDIDAQRMFARSVIRQVQAQGVDVDALIAA